MEGEKVRWGGAGEVVVEEEEVRAATACWAA